MEDILTRIVEDKRLELSALMDEKPIGRLREEALGAPASRLSFSGALRSSGSGIIAEFKRKSPSKGWIHADADPLKVIPEYASSGAAALSVLTDGKYFGGELGFIRAVRPMVEIPILRKDFIISDYQLLEARAAGADAVLLIAACLPVETCASLVESAHGLGLEVLLEIHSPQEMDYLACGADAVGINNRNLGTFNVDVENSFRLAAELSSRAAGLGGNSPVLVSESGISRPSTVKALRDKGFRGFLMGENFMKEEDPGLALKQFIAGL